MQPQKKKPQESVQKLVDESVIILAKSNPKRMCKRLNIQKDDIAPFLKTKIRQVIDERTQKIMDQKLHFKARGEKQSLIQIMINEGIIDKRAVSKFLLSRNDKSNINSRNSTNNQT